MSGIKIHFVIEKNAKSVNVLVQQLQLINQQKRCSFAIDHIFLLR
jgi:hypothetical protein